MVRGSWYHPIFASNVVNHSGEEYGIALLAIITGLIGIVSARTVAVSVNTQEDLNWLTSDNG